VHPKETFRKNPIKKKKKKKKRLCHYRLFPKIWGYLGSNIMACDRLEIFVAAGPPPSFGCPGVANLFDTLKRSHPGHQK
jgi:hypothetical protein